MNAGAEHLYARFRDNFAGDTDIFLQKLDAFEQTLLAVDMRGGAAFQASFLDDRVLQYAPPTVWIPFAEAAERVRRLPAPAHAPGFIFHVGHCGSTLVSRLIGACEGFSSLREPLALRQLTELWQERAMPWSPVSVRRWHDWLELFLRSWSRGQEPGDHCIIKATSLSNLIAPVLLAEDANRRAISLSLSLEVYLPVMLAPNRAPMDLYLGARNRLARHRALVPELPWRLHDLSWGELAAVSWICERLSLARLEHDFPEQVIPVDFDAFLATPEASLCRIGEHFGRRLEPEAVQQALNTNIMRQYSKAPEHPYSPDIRRAVLAEARQTHAQEIRKGLRLAEEAARHYGELGQLIEARSGLMETA